MSADQKAESRRMPSLPVIVRHWAQNHAEVWPALPSAVIGWGEPFCFRCGWLTPASSGSWKDANGWLERAHLQDHMTGGPDLPHNLVPLCALCHRSMPDFPHSRDAAIAWVGKQGHNSCPVWWQVRTDDLWSEGSTPFPGRVAFINRFFASAEANERAKAAVTCAVNGDYAGARQSLSLAGFTPERISELLSRFVNERALERAGAV